MSDIKRIGAGELFLVPASEMEKAAKEGHQIVTMKQPVALPIPDLTTRENTCLKYYALDCLVVKQIANKMQISDRSVLIILSSLRDKFECATNNGLVAKFYISGWHQLI